MKKEIFKARFANVPRFIDDLTALNDGGEFELRFKGICNPELVPKKENLSNYWKCFLDLLIKVENNQFPIQLNDKRDCYPFSIVRILYLRSNIPSKMFCST